MEMPLVTLLIPALWASAISGMAKTYNKEGNNLFG